jgi:hypothetical protein
MNRIAILVGLALSMVLLQSCAATGTTSQLPIASPAGWGQGQPALSQPNTRISKSQAEKIAMKAFHRWCGCDYGRIDGAALVHGNPPYWNVKIAMMMCDAHIWVNARNGNVMRIRRRC